nr:glycosyltransferase [Arachidicoccus ginsenosidivorans]
MYIVAIVKLLFRTKTRMIYTEHSTYNKRRKYFLTRFVDRIVYNQFDCIVCISQLVLDKLTIHLSNSHVKLYVIHNGVDLAKIKASNPIDLEDLGIINDLKSKYILQVSSFRYPKDQETVIKALRELPINVKLIFVGDGPNVIECKRLSKELNLDDRIYFWELGTIFFGF